MNLNSILFHHFKKCIVCILSIFFHLNVLRAHCERRNVISPNTCTHSGPEGHSGERKLIIYIPYIFEMVKQNAIQIHWNLNWALREFNIMDIYFCLYYGYPQWIFIILRGFSSFVLKIEKYPHSVIYFLKDIIEAYLKM